MAPRLLLLGTRGPMTRALMVALLAAGHGPSAVVIAGGPPGWHPLATGPVGDLPLHPAATDTLTVARAASLPLISVGAVDGRTVEGVAALAPDLLLVACWPARLPQRLLQLPAHGSLNVHPSLLPAYRGPAPIFWQLRAGERGGGVTIHRMSDRLDEGPIVAQRRLRWPEGASGAELDVLAGRVGAELAVDLLERLDRGALPEQPQPAGGSGQSWPEAADFALPRDWPASRVWSFVRGTTEWGRPYTIRTERGAIQVSEAVAFDSGAAPARSISRQGDRVVVRFSPGTVTFRAA